MGSSSENKNHKKESEEDRGVIGGAVKGEEEEDKHGEEAVPGLTWLVLTNHMQGSCDT